MLRAAWVVHSPVGLAVIRGRRCQRQRVSGVTSQPTQGAGEGLSNRSEQSLVVAELRAVYLSIGRTQLVAQDDDLEVLGAV